jgi:uncharacterized protein YjbJ (UPF0337 family)
MGNDDKTRNVVENITGESKEKVGKVTGDAEMEHEGRTDQQKADVKQAGEKIKDAFKH